MTTTVADLMSAPAQQHDVDWLKASLQTAIELELATIPPYLCAVWSITDTGHPVYDLLHEVVMEEMYHLGLACNMLTTLGGTPNLRAVPKYPSKLPGGVRPNLVVPLRGLTKEGVKDVFMEIERPPKDLAGRLPDDATPTIGAFYGAIREAFAALPSGAVTGWHQLKRSFSTIDPELTPITTVADALTAIDRILIEGEGTSLSAENPTETSPGDLAHYFRFAEIYHGKTLVKDGQGKWVFEGPPIDFPDALPMAEVPPGGYKPDEVPAGVQGKLAAFDQLFTKMIEALQAAWEHGDQAKLGAGVQAMWPMTTAAVALMNEPRTSGGGNYGPCFRLV